MNARFFDISVLRVLAMILVVYYHCICPYYIWPAGIDSAGIIVPLYKELSLGLVVTHVPVFFLIAGYLFGYKRFRGGGMLIRRSFLSVRRSVCLCRILR